MAEMQHRFQKRLRTILTEVEVILGEKNANEVKRLVGLLGVLRSAVDARHCAMANRERRFLDYAICQEREAEQLLTHAHTLVREAQDG